jgi:hypothetical protein
MMTPIDRLRGNQYKAKRRKRRRRRVYGKSGGGKKNTTFVSPLPRILQHHRHILLPPDEKHVFSIKMYYIIKYKRNIKIPKVSTEN